MRKYRMRSCTYSCNTYKWVHLAEENYLIFHKIEDNM